MLNMATHQENSPTNNPTPYQNYPFQSHYGYPYQYPMFPPQFYPNLNQNNIFPEIKEEDLKDIEQKQEVSKEDYPKNDLHSQSEVVPTKQHSNFNYNSSFGYPTENCFYPFSNQFNYFQNNFSMFPPFWQNVSSSGEKTNIDNNSEKQNGQNYGFTPVNSTLDSLADFEDNVEVKEEEQSSSLETSDLGSSMNKTPDLADSSLDGSNQASLSLSNESPIKDSMVSLNECIDVPKLPQEDLSINEITSKSDVNNLAKLLSNKQIQIIQIKKEEPSKEGFNNAEKYSEWISDETLPEGWKKRYCKKYKRQYQYLSENKQIFSSRTEVVAYMKNSMGYSENDILKVLYGKQNFSHSHTIEWHEDSALPNGWKTGKKKRYHYFLTRENKKIKTISAAIKFMIESKQYSADEIEKMKERFMRRFIYTSDSNKVIGKVQQIGQIVQWEEDDLLPPGWKRRYANGHHHFLSPENKRFQSVSATVHFMRNSGKYSEQEVDQILEVGRIQSLKKTTNNQQGLQRIGNSSSSTVSANWETHDSLPKGWKKRYANHHHMFLSPENKRFQSLHSALMFMKSANYSQDDIVKLVEVCREQSKKLTTNRDVGRLGDLFYNG